MWRGLHCLYSPHTLLELWYCTHQHGQISPSQPGLMTSSFCVSVWMAADAHSFPSLYEQHLFSRIHPFNLNPNEIFSRFFSPFLPHRRRWLPVRAMWKWRHLHRQDWFIPLPLPAQLWRRHMRERWEWEYCTHAHGWRADQDMRGANCYESFVQMKCVCVALTDPAHCCVRNHRGELVKIQSSDTSSKQFVANCAGGNNPDQDAASVTAICHDTISQRRISLQPSDSVSVCVTGLKGDRYWLKLLQARQYTHCFSSIS